MDATPEQVEAGHAFYTRRTLAVYDAMILGYFSRLAWKCPARRIVAHYDEHVTTNHLDVGVGTGYFLDHCHFSSAPRLAVMDPNVHCLDVASHRLARYAPETYRASVLEPIPFDQPMFDSVGLNYVLHCLPGDLAAKAIVFEHLTALTNPGGVIFGATLLHDGVPRNWLARQVMDRNNEHGIFSNANDSLIALESALSRHLTNPAIEVVGCVALFHGTV